MILSRDLNEVREQAQHIAWENTVGRLDSKCKSTEADEGLVFSRNSENSRVAGAEGGEK